MINSVGGVHMKFKLSDFKVLNVKTSQRREVIDYGVRMIGAPLEWPETMGKGIKVGVIDTGIDINHEDLQGRIKEYINFTSSDRQDVNDENGHGTHVAGIIAANRNGTGVVGVSPEVDLYIAKAFDKDGMADFEAIARSLIWLAECNVDVINMSFSSDYISREYYYLISELYRSGITMVCAAGNKGKNQESDTTIGYPAKLEETIAVTAVDINKERADFSSIGPEAEIAAAGKEVYSCYKNNSYAVLSGTSMAAPAITGAVALLQAKSVKKQNKKLSPEEVRSVLHMYSEDLGEAGKDPEYGYGVFSFGRIRESDSVSKLAVESNERIKKPSLLFRNLMRYQM